MANRRYKVQAVATMLGVSTDTVRRLCDEAKIEVERQGGGGPKTRIFSIENIYDIAAYRALKHATRTGKKLILIVYAPKGGVGKTTKASNIACALALRGLKVLVIDLDFQANLTMAFGYDPELTHEDAINQGIPAENCVDYHVGHLMSIWNSADNVVPLEKVLKKPYGENGPHLIPADVSFDRLDGALTLDVIKGGRSDLAFARLLREGRKGDNPKLDMSGYDIIMFDAPPAKNQTTRGALLASDAVLTPVTMDKYSTKSVSYLASVLTEMHRDYDKYPELVMLGNFYDERKSRVAVEMEKLSQVYPQDSWLQTHVSTSEEFRKVLGDEDIMPLVLSRPTSAPAAELRAVTQELIHRTGLM